MEDKASVTYECQSCGGTALVQSEVQHKDGCKSRLAFNRVCTKSGHPPHDGRP